MATCIIDNREREVVQWYQEHTLEHQTASLPIGDILLQQGEETLVFERKTIADLAASIKDGRFKEQKQRLTSTYPFHRITYVIEGNWKNVQSTEMMYGMPTKALISALISSRYRDGFQVIHTESVADTVRYIEDIRSRMGEKTTFSVDQKEDYVASLRVKTKKNENVTPSLCYWMQLSQLPTISITIAQEIALTYPTMMSFMEAIREKGAGAFRDIKGMGAKRSAICVEYMNPSA